MSCQKGHEKINALQAAAETKVQEVKAKMRIWSAETGTAEIWSTEMDERTLTFMSRPA